MDKKLKYMGFCAALAMSAAPMSAFAQDAAATESTGLGDIVVTAQFKEQNVQDTAIAITAISGETLQARGVTSVTDIAKQTPGVTLQPAGAFSGPALVAFIRGVGQTDFNPALEPGVGLYVDDVYFSTLTGSVLDLLDLERVEVLRGPQGTLAGRNSIGGAIKLFSVKPSDEANGYVEATVGEYDQVKFRGATNFTLIEDKLWGRVSGVSNSKTGQVTRYDYGCVYPASGVPTNRLGAGCAVGTDGDVDYTAARLALRWAPNDDLDVNFSYDVVEDSSGATPSTLLAAGPTIAPVFGRSGPPFVAWETVAAGLPPAANLGCQFVPNGPGTCNTAPLNDPYASFATYNDYRNGLQLPLDRTLSSKGASLNVDWALANGLKLTSITGYREYNSSFAGDYDASPVPVVTIYQTNKHSQLSQELRLSGAVGTLADWTVGAFYFDSESSLEGRIDLGYVGFDFIHGPDPVEAKSSALFASGTVNVTDQLSVDLGIRYSEDEKIYTYLRRNPNLSPIQPCVGPPGTPGNPANCLISTLNGAVGTFKDDRLDYRLSINYDLTSDIMAYISYTTGYKGGGVNPRPFYNVQAVSFKPEELQTVELGVKSKLFDNRLRLNAAIFSNTYDDIQLQVNDCTVQFGPVFGRPCLAQFNAGSADVSGFELEANFLATENLLIDASLSTLDFEFNKIEAATGLPITSVPAYTPELTWSLGVQYDFNTSFGTIRPRLDASYQDDVFTDSLNTSLGKIDSYTLINGSLRWISSDESWSASLDARNLGDELYYTNKDNTLPALGGTLAGVPAYPRTFSLTVRRDF